MTVASVPFGTSTTPVTGLRELARARELAALRAAMEAGQ
jgi:hypothetical protein